MDQNFNPMDERCNHPFRNPTLFSATWAQKLVSNYFPIKLIANVDLN